MSISKTPWRAMRWWHEAGMTLADATDDDERAEWARAPIKRIAAADGSSVAHCHDCAEISEDNARLLAAAPDLYLALREMMYEFEPADGADSDALTLARAALAKVSG